MPLSRQETFVAVGERVPASQFHVGGIVIPQEGADVVDAMREELAKVRGAVPGGSIEVFAFVDVHNGGLVVAWRVATVKPIH